MASLLLEASSLLSQNHSILANGIRLNDIYKEKSILAFHELDERERMEDKYICRLQTHQCKKGDMNSDTHAYVKKMYQQALINSVYNMKIFNTL